MRHRHYLGFRVAGLIRVEPFRVHSQARRGLSTILHFLHAPTLVSADIELLYALHRFAYVEGGAVNWSCSCDQLYVDYLGDTCRR